MRLNALAANGIALVRQVYTPKLRIRIAAARFEPVAAPEGSSATVALTSGHCPPDHAPQRTSLGSRYLTLPQEVSRDTIRPQVFLAAVHASTYLRLKAGRFLGLQDGFNMRNEFTAVIERDDEWIIAHCPEIPGANGQGKTKDEALASLRDAISLILQDRREDGLRAVPVEAERETVVIE